jgi:hypothetical protein
MYLFELDNRPSQRWHTLPRPRYLRPLDNDQGALLQNMLDGYKRRESRYENLNYPSLRFYGSGSFGKSEDDSLRGDSMLEILHTVPSRQWYTEPVPH